MKIVCYSFFIFRDYVVALYKLRSYTQACIFASHYLCSVICAKHRSDTAEHPVFPQLLRQRRVYTTRLQQLLNFF
jgi:hypothetical protein